MKFVSAFVLFASLAAIQAAPYHASTEEMIVFINSIELAEPKFKVPLSNMSLVKVDLPPDNKAEGYVVGEGIASFVETVSGQAKQDILDATLFAELAAATKYDKSKDPIGFFKYYTYVLTNIGFVTQGFNFHNYDSHGKAFSMDVAVVEIIAAFVSGGQTAVVEASLAALRGMADNDDRIQLFSHQSVSDNNGDFLIQPCVQSGSGDVAMTLGAFDFTASQKRTDFLFFRYASSDLHLQSSVQSTVLNAAAFSTVRSTIIEKLGYRRQTFVLQFDFDA